MVEILITADRTVFEWINSSLSSGFLDAVLIPLRHKLFWIPMYLFLIVYIFMNYPASRWIIILSLVMTVGVCDAFNSHILKEYFERLRPCHCEELNAVTRIACGHGYSFPSSHATNHFGMGTFLFLLFSFSSWRWIFMAWACLIALAQVYVGVHYPSDVLGGALVGFIIGGGIYVIFIFLKKRFKIYDTDS